MKKLQKIFTDINSCLIHLMLIQTINYNMNVLTMPLLEFFCKYCKDLS